MDVDEIVKQDKESGSNKLEILKTALQTIYDDLNPSEEEKEAMEAYIDKFVSVSLKDPETMQIVIDVQIHKHTKTCMSRGSDCRFYFPQFPSLRTIISVPLRILYPDDEERKKEVHDKIKLVFGAVKKVLENEEEMENANNIYKEELDKLVENRDYAMRSKKILDDKIFVKQLKKGTRKIYHKDPDCPKSSLKETELLLLENLKTFNSHYENLAQDQALELPNWRKRRLLYVLEKAELFSILEIDRNENFAEELLLEIYHTLLGFSTKGFSVVLKRDVDEIYVNKYNSEWLQVWSANLDFSPVFDFYGIISYVADYYMKVRKSFITFLKIDFLFTG